MLFFKTIGLSFFSFHGIKQDTIFITLSALKTDIKLKYVERQKIELQNQSLDLLVLCIVKGP